MTWIPPPWRVFPTLRAEDTPTQGAEEAYIDLKWLPFWQSLGALERQRYLDRWQTSSEWRAVIRERYDPDFDVEADSRESGDWARR